MRTTTTTHHKVFAGRAARRPAARDLGAAATPLARRPLAMSHRTGAPLERGGGGGSKVLAVCHPTLALAGRPLQCVEGRVQHVILIGVPSAQRDLPGLKRSGAMLACFLRCFGKVERQDIYTITFGACSVARAGQTWWWWWWQQLRITSGRLPLIGGSMTLSFSIPSH